jgi:hypothetical protein
MHEDFDYNVAHSESRNLAEDSGPLVGLILTLSGPSTSKSIVMSSDLDEETKITWEVLKVQLIFD